MLVCRRDVRLAVLAVKSLFRFLNVSIGVTLTSDGSITRREQKWIDSHILNARWCERFACDGRLAEYPELRNLYRSNYHPLCKLLHPLLLGAAERVIVLDPDTAFFAAPTRILEWIQSGAGHALYVHDNQDESRQVPGEVREGFEEVRSLFVQAGCQWKMPYYFFNSGLLAYCRSDLCLDFAEMYLSWWKSAPKRFKSGKSALWFGNWTPEQTCYQTLFASMKVSPEPLGEQYQIGAKANGVFNHFLWLQLVEESSLRRLEGLVQVMSSKGEDAYSSLCGN